MFSDITLQTLHEASQFIQTERENKEGTASGSNLSNRTYALLLKNVSKDDPLSQDELQVS
jgi:hypothetical protein